jgi:hypothetical protein
MVAGMICIEQEPRMTSVQTESQAAPVRPETSCSLDAARMESGVAALPSPKRLAETEAAISPRKA